ncbi:DUF3800 domain-containing protein [Streptomyces sp. NBC_00047]|uniref:DUF3800 domain-containing protein n=1 Tax=Streptomyces sp. NBC_00047 TaxID=2975627 RepID=UPI00225B3EAC|nr:DUF3800 domain-containing protein [Streptomyces sp. NBC_00047]MCX5613535.1 DUF3800 domain-containing protein [Streptomyces sp. NBC_00047]
MPLTGPEYERFTRTAPTLNCETDGRWIASDESGYDGEDLLADGRYMMVAGVAVDDAEAELILRDLRKETNIQPTARELKFKHFQRGDRLEKMSRLWRSGGALHGRCSVFVIDKRYAIMSKTIDLLAEEEAYRRGIDLYANGRARKLARALACDGRRALKDERFERLEQAFVAFARRKDPGDRQAVIQTFYSEVEAAWAASTRRNVTEALELLRATRVHAEELHSGTGTQSPPHLELLDTAVATLARAWGERLGPVSIMADEHRELTDTRIDSITSVLRTGAGPTLSSLLRPVRIRHMVRGSSHDHPAIQLADLLAGAAGTVAKHTLGHTTEAGALLRPIILPLIEKTSLVPTDDSDPFLSAPGRS